MIMNSWTGLAENRYKKFNNGMNRYVKLLVFMLMLSVVFSAQADSSYISIQEMRDNVPSTWTETLKGGKKSFDCTIDAPIVVPEVECFPILLVDFQGIIPGLEAKGYHVEDHTGHEALIESCPSATVERNIGSSGISEYHEDLMTAEMIAEAEEKAQDVLRKIWDMNGTNLEKLGVTKYRTEDTEYRMTSVLYCPTYNGIAYLQCPQSLVGTKGCAERPFNYVDAFWREDVEFEGAHICISRLIGEYLSDVPLLPFEQIQDVIRQRIQEGYVQSIYEIRLGYICSNDPEHPGENYFLTPAWVVCGVMNSNPNIPFYPDDYLPAQRYLGSKLVINAQTGEIVELNSHSKETFDAHILTWEDVK